MKLSVIIVNYNVKYFLSQCLHSVESAVSGIDAEIIVVDNASSDGSVEFIRERFPNVKVIANKENVGFSRANNQAIRDSKGEFVLLLNPDTIVAEDTFSLVLSHMGKHEDVGGMGVRMIDGKGEFLPESKRGLPTPEVAFYKMFGLSKLFPNSKKFGQYHLSFLPEDKITEVDVLSGAFMLIRKSVLDKIGLLDETFFMYGEDIDLSYRIQKAGYKNIYFPETTIIHYKGESTKKGSLNYIKVFYSAMVIFAQKHFAKNRTILFSLVIQLAVVTRALWDLFKRVLHSVSLPIIDGLVFSFLFFVIFKNYVEAKNIIVNEEILRFDFPLLIASWLLGLFISGAYDRPVRISRVFMGTIFGMIFGLICYSFLPESYRFSRLIMLTLFASLFLFVPLFRILLSLTPIFIFKIQKKENLRALVIGEKVEREETSKLLNILGFNPKVLVPVYPHQNETDEKNTFCGTLKTTELIVEDFKINDALFYPGKLSFKEIIGKMDSLKKYHLDFKTILPKESVIIGSSSIHSSGNYISLSKISSISRPENRRVKRLFDIFFSVIVLILFPIFLLGNLLFLKNFFHVLLGKKTWVGPKEENEKLMKKGVFFPQIPSLNEEESIAEYTLNYSVLLDMEIVIQNLR